MVLDTPAATTQTWTGKSLTAAFDATVGASTPIRASFNFVTHANQVVQAKVGISFISAEQARQNVQQEVPPGTSPLSTMRPQHCGTRSWQS
jgi:putative alpha-1,2-mannosidase